MDLTSKSKSFSRVLAGLGIRNVGKNCADLIINVYPSIDLLMKASVEDLSKIDGVGPVVANNIVEFFSNLDNIDVIDRLKKHGLQLDDSSLVHNRSLQNKPLKDKTFVLTGTLVKSNMTRTEASNKLKHLGAKVSSSVIDEINRRIINN